MRLSTVAILALAALTACASGTAQEKPIPREVALELENYQLKNANLQQQLQLIQQNIQQNAEGYNAKVVKLCTDAGIGLKECGVDIYAKCTADKPETCPKVYKVKAAAAPPAEAKPPAGK